MKVLLILCPRIILGNSLGTTAIVMALPPVLLCCEIPFATPQAQMTGDSVEKLSSSVMRIVLLCTYAF